MNNHQKKRNSVKKYFPVAPMKLWQDHGQTEEVAINVVPLIDVVFCILTFFMLGAVSLSRQQAINLDLPKAQTATSQMQKMLVVSLDEMGNLYLEKEPTNETRLNQAIVQYYQQNPQGLVVLHASRNTSYNNVVRILDLLRSIGGDRIALATLPGQSNNNNLTPNNNLPSGLPNQNNLGLPNNNLPDQNYSIPNTTLPQPNPNQPIENNINNLPQTNSNQPIDNNINNNNLPVQPTTAPTPNLP